MEQQENISQLSLENPEMTEKKSVAKSAQRAVVTVVLPLRRRRKTVTRRGVKLFKKFK